MSDKCEDEINDPVFPLSAHDWDVSRAEAENIQRRLAKSVIYSDLLSDPICVVAGVDVAQSPQHDNQVVATVVVVDVGSMKTVETQAVISKTNFPYAPGLFSFREIPPLLLAFRKVKQMPHLVICDGQGVAHPRRCGLASHLGLLLDIPTIGCGKTYYVGKYEEPAWTRGSSSPLVDQNEIVGSVLRTQNGIKPLFVSVGHRVSLTTAKDWVLRMAVRFRQPEPIRRANELANTVRAAL